MINKTLLNIKTYWLPERLLKISISMVLLLIGLFAINCLFAILYWAFGTISANGFYEYLYFAMVTGSTIGYGDITPKETARIVVGFQHWLTLCYVALITAKLFFDWNNGLNKIKIDKILRIAESNKDDGMSFKIRVGNISKRPVTDIEAIFLLFQYDKEFKNRYTIGSYKTLYIDNVLNVVFPFQDIDSTVRRKIRQAFHNYQNGDEEAQAKWNFFFFISGKYGKFGRFSSEAFFEISDIEDKRKWADVITWENKKQVGPIWKNMNKLKIEDEKGNIEIIEYSIKKLLFSPLEQIKKLNDAQIPKKI